MPNKRYTKELLAPIVKESYSVAEVLRKLGYKKYGGGHHTHLTKRLKDFEIDTSHFSGQGWSKGRLLGARKMPGQILVLRQSGHRPKASQLRRALIAVGTLYICSECGMGPIWNGKELTLEVDHKNGNFLDNRRTNLRFLCPNCHSQE